MSQAPGTQRTKILTYLKSIAPYSIVDRGVRLATEEAVAECSQSEGTINGVVRVEGETFALTLRIVSTHQVSAQCSCSSNEEMDEQWCVHAVALIWRALELGFFDAHSGFASRESTYKLNTSSPEDVANVIAELSLPRPKSSETPTYTPRVRIVICQNADRLGVKLYFDNQNQGPALFESFKKESRRTLDNLFLRMLEEEGSWDEGAGVWYINSSHGIELVLGLSREYNSVLSEEGQPLSVKDDILEACLTINWVENGAELSMQWSLPDGSSHDKRSELIGTGPYWVLINRDVYRVSESAAQIASIFSGVGRLFVARAQAGPILEVVRSELLSPWVRIQNPELQPASIVRQPSPALELERREDESEHFSSHRSAHIMARLEFEYPEPPKSKNVVHLRDRDKEREHIDTLKRLGFEAHGEAGRYEVQGDAALDIISRGEKLFPAEWRIEGLERLRKGMRFSELEVHVHLAAAQNSPLKGGPSKDPSQESPDQVSGEGRDWYDCHVSLVQNKAHVPLSTLFKHLKGQGDRWIRLDTGSYARVPGGSLRELKTSLGILDPAFRLSNTIRAKLNTAQALGFARLENEQFHITLDRNLRKLSRKLDDFKSITSKKPSRNFHGKLRPYQEEGLGWMTFLNEFELGGILADEMGLGKTVQALALIQGMKEQSKAGSWKPALVVAPTSVITNWAHEAWRFTPKLKVLLLHGPGRKAFFSQISEHDLVVTSYALLRLDRAELERHEFSYAILDEAQNIKNHQAATTAAAKALRAQRRLALTGTPTENRPMELWSIMDFLMPGFLGSQEFFRTYIEKPILENVADAQVTSFLKRKTRPFVLRRTKQEVEKDLPPKVESVQYVAMTETQRGLYQQILNEVRPKIFEVIEKKGIAGASVSILTALLRLRQVCNHPNSIESFKDVAGFESGKFNLLQELVEEALDSGAKILLFCQFREMLAIIRRWLDERTERYLYLDGTTRNRQQLIDQFNLDESVRIFLISLKAGGTGLNLTAANTVIIYDPWWNPAVESQAVDRAHRIGQTKTVSVYRLVTENSVESKIMELKEKKSRIVDVLINEKGLTPRTLSKGDLESLFAPLAPEFVKINQ